MQLVMTVLSAHASEAYGARDDQRINQSEGAGMSSVMTVEAQERWGLF